MISMTPEEQSAMMKDIERMNNETMAAIKQSMEIFDSCVEEFGKNFPELIESDIPSIMKETLTTAEENGKIIGSIRTQIAYNDAMDSVIPK